MSSSKRRKLNDSPHPPQLSAFAARQTFATKESNISTPSRSNSNGTITTTNQSFVPVTDPLVEATAVPELQDVRAEERTLQPTEVESYSTAKRSDIMAFDIYPISSSQSRAESPELALEKPAIILSTFTPSKVNVKELADGSLSFRLVPGERLIVLGQYEISIQNGQIALMGSILKASETNYRVYASSSHSLPVIRCLAADVDEAVIRLCSLENGLGKLNRLSPLFGKLWNDGLGPLGLNHISLLQRNKRSSFQILFSSKDGPQKVALHPLISPPEWNEALSRLSGANPRKTLAVMVCGPKSSGKSTFSKMLSNRLLSTAMEGSEAKSRKPPGVALLDLDPGQPEFSIPGQLSLIHVQGPDFGAPYSHPIPGTKSRLVRAHTLGTVSPSMDPNLYIACALDLFAHYRNLLSAVPNCPLVINTPGWVLGTGLEILVDLILKVRPTEVIYMSQDGPAEVVESLKDAANTIPLLTLPSQASEFTTRTSAHLRTMQSMSYFHLDPTSKDGFSWNAVPLTSMPPWVIRYSGPGAGILGIICYGEQPPANLLADSINGSLVAVVVIDDMAAIPGWKAEEQDSMDEYEKSECVGKYQYNMATDAEIRAIDTNSLQPRYLQRPLIVRTPLDDMPYFNPANATSLDPKYSHCIGLALVRGIDGSRRQLQLLIPSQLSVIEEVNEAGKAIVLVSGKFDTPGWAYTEELVEKSMTEKASKTENEDMDVGEEEEGTDCGEQKMYVKGKGRSLGEGFQSAPWVETLEGSQGRGVGARVWRVRRDLGKTAEVASNRLVQ